MTRSEQELKDEVLERVDEALERYFDSFHANGDLKGKGLPTIEDLEKTITSLRSETRNIYLDMVSKSITNFDESELIDAKKGSTRGRG